MRCRRDTRFRAGYQLRTITSAANATTSTTYQTGCVAAVSAGAESPTAAAAVEVSTTRRASTIVSKSNQEKLPERTSHNCVTAMMAAATLATGCGANNPNGTISCATWLPATSMR